MTKTIDIIFEILEREQRPMCPAELAEASDRTLKAVRNAIDFYRTRVHPEGSRRIRIAHFGFFSRPQGISSAFFTIGDAPDAKRMASDKKHVVTGFCEIDWRATEMKKHDATMRELLPALAQVRGNPFGVVAVQWGAM